MIAATQSPRADSISRGDFPRSPALGRPRTQLQPTSSPEGNCEGHPADKAQCKQSQGYSIISQSQASPNCRVPSPFVLSYIHTYIHPDVPQQGQRALRRFLHLTRSWAAAARSSHSILITFASLSTERRQVVFGRPLLRLPGGCQVSMRFEGVSPGLLRVCPSHLHFLMRISWSIGFCLVSLHSSAFEMVRGQ